MNQNSRRHTFNSDGSRVLDRGVWKRFKYCSHCGLLIVERAKWKNCFEEVKYCSTKCRIAKKKSEDQQRE
eukprot:jgi/Picsp_1/468/NSC_00466-R1_hypothetical protein PCC7424_3546 [Cyanothece sp. PCC 7424]